MFYMRIGPVRRSLQKNPLSFYCTEGTQGYQQTKLNLHSHLVMYIDVDTYKSEVFQGLSAAWKLACEKTWAENPAWPSCVGDCVFVLMPAKQLGKTRKFARPYGGPYRTVAMCENFAEVKVIDKSVLTLSESPDKDSSSNVERPPLDWVATADQAQSRVWQNRLSPRQWPSKDSAWSQGWEM